jgi:hypothetical protein
MRTSTKALLDDPRFIPFVYDYCDRWCDRCKVSNRCLLFAERRERPLRPESESDAAQMEKAIAFGRAIVERTGPAQKAIAHLDVAFCDVRTAPREPALGHPLEFLARHYALQTAQFLASLDTPVGGEWPSGSPLDVVASYHFLIAVKTYRALVSHFASEETPELLPDALGCAKLILVCIDRSLEAWRSIAAREDDARVGGLIELLEALKTGVEMRFPEARGFIRRGLDEPLPVP